MTRVTQAEFSRLINVSRAAISKAVKAGRIAILDDGRLDSDVAILQWMSTTRPTYRHFSNVLSHVTQAEFARIAGVNRSTVNKWIKARRIETDAHGLIDPESAAKMREITESKKPHHQARKQQWKVLRGMTKEEMAAYHADICARKQAINNQIKEKQEEIRRLRAEAKDLANIEKEKYRRQTEKYKEYARQFQRRISEKLTDSYVTKILGKEFATPDVIELKRQQLAIRRLLKEFNAAIQPEKEISHAE